MALLFRILLARAYVTIEIPLNYREELLLEINCRMLDCHMALPLQRRCAYLSSPASFVSLAHIFIFIPFQALIEFSSWNLAPVLPQQVYQHQLKTTDWKKVMIIMPIMLVSYMCLQSNRYMYDPFEKNNEEYGCAGAPSVEQTADNNILRLCCLFWNLVCLCAPAPHSKSR